MPCSRCGTPHPLAGAASLGWIRVEFVGAVGVKYGYYCPQESLAVIAADVHDWASVSRQSTRASDPPPAVKKRIKR